ncbi:MAG: hypothetical protein ACUVTR_00845 [Dehalococcoidia bacterium]
MGIFEVALTRSEDEIWGRIYSKVADKQSSGDVYHKGGEVKGKTLSRMQGGERQDIVELKTRRLHWELARSWDFGMFPPGSYEPVSALRSGAGWLV